jgi:hypothetical protein
MFILTTMDAETMAKDTEIVENVGIESFTPNQELLKHVAVMATNGGDVMSQ